MLCALLDALFFHRKLTIWQSSLTVPRKSSFLSSGVFQRLELTLVKIFCSRLSFARNLVGVRNRLIVAMKSALTSSMRMQNSSFLLSFYRPIQSSTSRRKFHFPTQLSILRPTRTFSFSTVPITIRSFHSIAVVKSTSFLTANRSD